MINAAAAPQSYTSSFCYLEASYPVNRPRGICEYRHADPSCTRRCLAPLLPEHILATSRAELQMDPLHAANWACSAFAETGLEARCIGECTSFLTTRSMVLQLMSEHRSPWLVTISLAEDIGASQFLCKVAAADGHLLELSGSSTAHTTLRTSPTS
ncbi:hypothetical protein BST61_g8178 [Cercospora zeina]